MKLSYKQFLERLDAQQKASNISNESMAELLNVGYAQWRKIITGKSNISIKSYIELICPKLGITPAQLMQTQDGNNYTNEPTPFFSRNESNENMNEIIEHQKKIIEYQDQLIQRLSQ